ncbi:MAG: exo-alpha-sialidase [Phycisphaerae bacterium]|nr:exo-alpha-sialidase [Phycisphaerae bacterium]
MNGMAACAFSVSLVSASVAAAEGHSKIRVIRSVHIRQPDILEEACVMSVDYVSADKNTLMESVGYGRQREYYFRSRGKKDPSKNAGLHAIRISTDNGRTWKRIEDWPEYRPLKGNRRLCIREPNWLCNPKTGTLLRIYTTCEDIEGVLPWDRRSPASKTGRIYTQLSRDEGKTWGKPKQVIVPGAGRDETHWAPETWYGQNSGYVEGVEPVFLNDGRFLLPFYGDVSPKRARPDYGKYRSACLIGRWRADDSGVDWEMTAYASVSREHSNCGGNEPSVAVLRDGRLLMTMRVRVDKNDGTKTPSGRWFVTSEDNGKTWSAPGLLRYEDDQQVYNPACLAHVFRAS